MKLRRPPPLSALHHDTQTNHSAPLQNFLRGGSEKFNTLSPPSLETAQSQYMTYFLMKYGMKS